jgi:hypothetical protein
MGVTCVVKARLEWHAPYTGRPPLVPEVSAKGAGGTRPLSVAANQGALPFSAAFSSHAAFASTMSGDLSTRAASVSHDTA